MSDTIGNTDRLFNLLPLIVQQRDAESGWPLRALLRVIAEQVNIVEADIARLYDNWFIETCEDWVVPYIGDLIGYLPVHDAGTPSAITTDEGRRHNDILFPRREVANTIRYRRRKGTLALLEAIGRDASGWEALRAVEFFPDLALCQRLDNRTLTRGHTVDLRAGDLLDRIDGPFDTSSHTVDLRSIDSYSSAGWYDIANIGLFVWRLRPYHIAHCQAYCLEGQNPHCFAFSALSNDAPLYNGQVASDTTHHDERNLPVPIRRRAFALDPATYYGPGKSIAIAAPNWNNLGPTGAIPLADIIGADLSGWRYRPPLGKVAVDPERGRIMFPRQQQPRDGVSVSYWYGFSADIGGGSYDRPITQPPGATLYRVRQGTPEGDASKLSHDAALGATVYGSIASAVKQWQQEQPIHAVIEIEDSTVYTETQLPDIVLRAGETLQVRAKNGARPSIRLLDVNFSGMDAIRAECAPGSCFTLDGLLITGRGLEVRGPSDAEESTQTKPVNGKHTQQANAPGNPGVAPARSAHADAQEAEPHGGTPVNTSDTPNCDTATLIVRHSTLVPGWSIDQDCNADKPWGASLIIENVAIHLHIAHSIVGSINIAQDAAIFDPVAVTIVDSVVDATRSEDYALWSGYDSRAFAVLSIARSTVFGQVFVHTIEHAENCIFTDRVTVSRRQTGCVRFSYLPENSRTPPRFHCQPDLAMATEAEFDGAARWHVADAVRPRFRSVQYGRPAYSQLAGSCPDAITRGADDESEMGVFHDLFQPQRAANLRVRLDEFTPADAHAGIIFVT